MVKRSRKTRGDTVPSNPKKTDGRVCSDLKSFLFLKGLKDYGCYREDVVESGTHIFDKCDYL